jgi:uncharacterized integral membrane protein
LRSVRRGNYPNVTTEPIHGGAHPEDGRGERLRDTGRGARRWGLLLLGLAALGLLIAWVAANTQDVQVDWLFGSTEGSLALIIFVAAAVGWVLGLVTAAATSLRRRRRGRHAAAARGVGR